jgi:hypothetical protein
MPKPATWSCNACDHEGKTSREHFLHIAIGRVILGNRNLKPDEVRAHLQNDHFRDFRYFESIDDDIDTAPLAWLNQELRGLICETCNNRWARQLEEDAGYNLYNFTLGRGRADGPLLRRWAWYFAIKLWFLGVRPEALADGPLRPVLRSLADPTVMVQMPVLVGRLDASPREWNFAAAAKGWRGGDADTPFMAWIIRGVVWIVTATDATKVTLPIPATPLTNGLRIQDAARVPRRLIPRLVLAPGRKLAGDPH